MSAGTHGAFIPTVQCSALRTGLNRDAKVVRTATPKDVIPPCEVRTESSHIYCDSCDMYRLTLASVKYLRRSNPPPWNSRLSLDLLGNSYGQRRRGRLYILENDPTSAVPHSGQREHQAIFPRECVQCRGMRIYFSWFSNALDCVSCEYAQESFKGLDLGECHQGTAPDRMLNIDVWKRKEKAQRVMDTSVCPMGTERELNARLQGQCNFTRAAST